jgi:hypothetical protein
VIEHPVTPAADVDPPDEQRASDAVRAQLLATEHWSLLATRSQTWSEIMNRITIHLTVTSASLVVLVLVVQSSGYGTPFHVLSIGLASTVLVLGTLTSLRVQNASVDDAQLVIGMNRLRAGYLAIDPGVAQYLVTSWHDDEPGMMETYTMGRRRRNASHIVGSTSFFLIVVNTIVAGSLGGLVAYVAGAPITGIAVSGSITAVLYFAAWVYVGARTFATLLQPRFPTGEGGP